MNKVAIVGATVAVFAVAAAAMAASPLPSTPPAASPGASPMASATPIASTAPTATASPGTTSSPAAGTSSASVKATASPQSWMGDVSPVNIKGTAQLTQNADGTGKLVLQLTGMVNEQNWTVDVEPGSVQHPNTADRIAYKQGSDVQKVAPDTIQVQLTKSEMDDFQHALAANPAGVTIFVSDGHRLSAATLTSAQ